MKVYHVTPKKNIPSILKNGLLPKIGSRSKSANETEKAIYVFPDWLSLEDALTNWLGDEFIERLSVLELDIPESWIKHDSVKWEATIKQKVPANHIRVLIDDVDEHDGSIPPGVVLEKQEPRDVDLWESVSDKKISDASWWLQRWISGSMNDPDWYHPENKLTFNQAFEIISQVVGNKRSLAKKTIWRYLSVSDQLADKIIKSKILPPNPKFPFQSFSGKRKEALAMKNSHQDKHILVSTKPSNDLVAFGMVDLMASKNSYIQGALMGLEDWYAQDEVIVRGTQPIPLLTASLIEFKPQEDIYEQYEDWEETYKDNKSFITVNGNPPKYLYRIMSKKEYEIAKELGYFYPRPGDRIHASSRPILKYSNFFDDIVVRFDYHIDDEWRPKWGDELYAITNKPIPFERATVITNFL